MMHVPTGSVAKPGDTIKDGDNHYVLQYFNVTVKDLVFRMFLTNEHGDLTRRVTVEDTVTGFARDETEAVIGHIYYGLESRSEQPDVGKFDRSTYRIITGFPLEIGDVISGTYRITEVRRDQGVSYAKATK